ncbi:FAD/NAD(P)-binding domain-containing protein [Phanerochaete sordida]|uniref:FAD/NAD(P)-binding domain-containing protein n=1 Tax=Phanerochaete sordida TaxID=48140 RepID=A0A9P3GN27_9APHY|nr:FAD/NAD(P)-binding domain-containing protein [Phanerochaete sordida]
MAVAATRDKLLHAATEAVLLPLTLFTFVFWELPKRVAGVVLCTLYELAQLPVIWAFKPPRPPKELKNPRARIAVIGAGLTGVSSAAHAIAHGFDVVIYEKSDKIGGIWTSVNKTSGLQLNSILYRFFPSVLWSRFFPHRDEILSEIEKIWKEYRLDERTRFNTAVTSVKRASGGGGEASRGDSKWIINDGADGEFDAVIVNIGTCGEPMMMKFPGMPGYKPEEQPAQNGHKHDSEKDDKPHQDNGEARGSKKPAWSSPDETKEAVKLKDGQRPRKNPDSPTQDEGATLPEKVGDVHGATVTTAGGEGAWDAVEEPTWEVGRDQVEKKEQGFPRPEEAFTPGPDVQKDTKRTAEPQQPKRKQKGKKHHDAEPKDRQDQDADSGEVFEKPILHSSQLTSSGIDFKDKTVVVIGGGASAVEAVETALPEGAKHTIMVVRDDKWIIPRNFIIDTLIAMQPFGMEMPLSFLWEKFITLWNYHGMSDLTPANTGLFQSTPVVNEEFLGHVRAGRCDYVRGDIVRLTKDGVRVNVRPRGSKAGDKGEEKEFAADVVVLATGFHRPDISFLPKDLFPEEYERPNLYLQNFPVEDWSVLMTNSAYMNAIGTVGHFHIGIYARILMTFLMDPAARPSPHDMRLWVDAVRFVKRGAQKGALGFFTYMELTIWLGLFHVFRPDRLRWMFFILNGWGVRPLK